MKTLYIKMGGVISMNNDDDTDALRLALDLKV